MTFENGGTFRILWSVAQDHPSWDVQFCTVRAYHGSECVPSEREEPLTPPRSATNQKTGMLDYTYVALIRDHPIYSSDFVFPTTDYNNDLCDNLWLDCVAVIGEMKERSCEQRTS
jgi:hypothetical protein